jgi:hypothetical protein
MDQMEYKALYGQSMDELVTRINLYAEDSWRLHTLIDNGDYPSYVNGVRWHICAVLERVKMPF